MTDSVKCSYQRKGYYLILRHWHYTVIGTEIMGLFQLYLPYEVSAWRQYTITQMCNPQLFKLNACDIQLCLYWYFITATSKQAKCWLWANLTFLYQVLILNQYRLWVSSDVTAGVQVQLQCCLAAQALAVWHPARISLGVKSKDLSVWDTNWWL